VERLKPLLYTVVSLTAILVVVALIGNAYQPPVRGYVPSIASSTVQVVPSETKSPIAVSDTATDAPSVVETTTSSRAPQLPATPKKEAGPVIVAAQTPATAPPPGVIPQTVVDSSLNSASASLRSALVNIICYAPAGGRLHSISGSGVIIDPKGIILTNAHIAQYFLLTDRGVVCKIRAGSPASDQYTGGLIYLPPQWIQDNASVLTTASPSGTGERDFALVGITKSLTATPLPASFPFVPLAMLALSKGAPVVIGSYGAQFLDYSQIQSALSPTLVYGSVKDIYTFTTNSIDVFARGGSAAALEGSSGGGVVNGVGQLAGTLVTSTMQGTTDTRQLDAITAAYIRAEYKRETGESLDSLITTPVATAISDFSPVATNLEKVLVAHLP